MYLYLVGEKESMNPVRCSFGLSTRPFDGYITNRTQHGPHFHGTATERQTGEGHLNYIQKFSSCITQNTHCQL